MKVQTSIALSEDLFKMIEQYCLNRHKDFSGFIEEASWSYISKNRNDLQEKNDLDIINKRAEYLNEEAEDILAYQVEI